MFSIYNIKKCVAMFRVMKRTLSLILSIVLLGGLCACGNKTAQTPETTQTTTEPVVTQPAGEAEVLKVLVLGHSLAVDTGHMLALVANAEGYESLKLGTLYYSGCMLSQHVDFLSRDAREYNLYVSSTDTPNQIPEIMQGVTMKEAIRYDYWDIIVMQAGAFELAEPAKMGNGNIQKIQNYVNEHKLNPTATFAWHMAWALPVNNDLRNMYPYPESNPYFSEYKRLFNEDRDTMYSAVAACVKDVILTDETFDFVIPCGTAMENALSSYWEETDIHRDYGHATDLARVMTSYVWYCRLAGIDKLDEIKLDVIPKQFFKSTQSPEDRVLTDAEKAIILESVNNALANPLQVTPSQYTTAP